MPPGLVFSISDLMQLEHFKSTHTDISGAGFFKTPEEMQDDTSVCLSVCLDEFPPHFSAVLTSHITKGTSSRAR